MQFFLFLHQIIVGTHVLDYQIPHLYGLEANKRKIKQSKMKIFWRALILLNGINNLTEQKVCILKYFSQNYYLFDLKIVK